ncbi:hypothetical protein AMECASPLE_028423 [Ameca splendens]|uniref:Uncharacterized protein n=1 Tax=Ameca splendens TaxID=208324 RepID=A0ABV0ZGS8_9TELE
MPSRSLYHTVWPGRQNEPAFPTATEVSCKLTLCLPSRGCFPQRPGQLLLCTVHIRALSISVPLFLTNSTSVGKTYLFQRANKPHQQKADLKPFLHTSS